MLTTYDVKYEMIKAYSIHILSIGEEGREGDQEEKVSSHVWIDGLTTLRRLLYLNHESMKKSE